VRTYGDIAREIGYPGAARAVGNACAKNPVPLLVPCHRVVRSDGGVGGYSLRGGSALKRRLLAQEGVDLGEVRAS
jgi:methylated-DNA-[protein]-cysteine S-methyltransferase